MTADRVIHRLTVGNIEMLAVRTAEGLFFRLMDGRNHVVVIHEDMVEVFADFVRATAAINPNG